MTPRRTLILFIFFLSGLSALIYQVAWVRQATLVFGVSVYAYSTVLTAFMGGSALGSYLWRRRANQTTNPLRLYALLQVGIGLWGALMPWLLPALLPLYAQLAQSINNNSVLLMLLRLTLAMLVLIPPTLLMGATLPVMARAYARSQGRVGGDVGQLYAVETLGAALGCALAGLFLLRWLGTRDTIWLAAGVNGIAALGAWSLARQGDKVTGGKGTAM